VRAWQGIDEFKAKIEVFGLKTKSKAGEGPGLSGAAMLPFFPR
jgi:hypothetical protein